MWVLSLKRGLVMFFKRKSNINLDNIPTHIAMIMDGNGRWAKKRGLSRSVGHRYGIENLKTVVELSLKFKIKFLTVYAFSIENWKRPKDEIETLFELMKQFFDSYGQELSDKGVRIKVIGTRENLSNDILEIIDKVENMTKDNDDLTLLIAFNYGFSEEILTCVKKITHKCLNNELTINDINNELIENNLYTSGVPNVDLLIRTSGEQRLSNFLLLQCSYAELYFTEVYWPDFKEQEYLAALNEYQKRQRRFGGL